VTIASTPTSWEFATELAEPLWSDLCWSGRQPSNDEADLRAGWHLDDRATQWQAGLETAYADLADFATAGAVPQGGPYPLVVEHDPTLEPEEHRIVVEAAQCTVSSGGPEGIRRAVFWLEDMMRARRGPFLPLGEHRRTPVITTRISRCFFGPINRPPANRDELLDDVDYYPEQYLNRLAHEGVNGLWMTIRLRDLVPTDWSGPVNGDPERRLTKLRRTVEACARYGIKIFLFCIDPAAFGDGPEYLVPSAGLAAHPEFGGHRSETFTAFCTNSEPGRAYVVETLGRIFSEVPGLGGLIDITIGERPTHCWSDVWSGKPINCPRCGPAGVGPSFAAHLRALRDGVRAGNPEARVISWMYCPYGPERGPYVGAGMADLLTEIAQHTPEGVTVQVNMESTGTTTQLEREFQVLDYSLAWVGPSEIFDRVSQAVAGAGAEMGAKLQVGCSHEVATVPYVPVPGNLYRKYTELHACGVSEVMQCWYFGNAPGPMTTAAGRLSFAPLPAAEADFLTELAAPDWGPDAPAMVGAWQQFREAYARFPATLPFSWFGPVHDAIMWPWHLDPVDEPIAPSWQLGWWPSGDRVGECFAPGYSFAEIDALVTSIAAQWADGWRQIASLVEKYARDRRRLLDLGVAEAMTLQWASAARTLRFHHVREQLARGERDGDRGAALDELAALVDAERGDTLRLADLAEIDSRLGFHSEAEGHKYHPAGLRQRHELLGEVAEGLARLRERLDDEELWPGWATPSAHDQTVVLATTAESATHQGIGDGVWSVWRDGADLCLRADVPASGDAADDTITFFVEARRLWPAVPFSVSRSGEAWTRSQLLPPSQRWQGTATDVGGHWQAEVRIPLEILRAPGMATRYGFRMNVVHRTDAQSVAWINQAEPLRRRLCFDDSNPANLGWVVPEAAGSPGVG